MYPCAMCDLITTLSPRPRKTLPLRRNNYSTVTAACHSSNARCLLLLLLAVPLFWRHVHCEPYMYVYSAFALCKWLFIASNIAFMSAIFIDGLHWRSSVVDAELQHSCSSSCCPLGNRNTSSERLTFDV